MLIILELEGNNIDDDYEFPGYNYELGWSNGKHNGMITLSMLIVFQEHRMIFSNRMWDNENL